MTRDESIRLVFRAIRDLVSRYRSATWPPPLTWTHVLADWIASDIVGQALQAIPVAFDTLEHTELVHYAASFGVPSTS